MSKPVPPKAAKALRAACEAITKTDQNLPLLDGTPNTVDEALETLGHSRKWLRRAERFAGQLQAKLAKKRAQEDAQVAALNRALHVAAKELRA